MDRSEKQSAKYVDLSPATAGLGRAAVQGGGITVVSRVACQAIQLGATMVLSRLLVPGDFGVVTMVTSIIGLALLFSDLGLTDATLQSDTISHEQASTLFWAITVVNVAVALLLALCSGLMAAFYRDPRVRPIALVLSLQVLVFGAGNQHYALLRRRLAFVQVSVASMVTAAVSNGLAVIAAVLGLGFWSLVVREFASAVGRAVAGWYLCKWRPGAIFSPAEAGGLLRFGAATAGSLGVSYLSDNLDKTLLGAVYGATPLGYYVRAFGLFTLPLGQFSSGLHHVAVATLSRVRSNKEEFTRFYLRALATLSLLAMPLGGVVAVTSTELVVFLFGRQWSQSAPLLTILAPVAGVRVLYMTHEWLSASLGRADRRLKWQLVSFLATASAIGIGVLFGPKGVAAGYSVVSGAMLIPAVLYAGQPAGLRFRRVVSSFWRSVVAAIVAASPCALAGRSIRASLEVFPALCTVAALYLFCYLCAIVALHRGFAPFRDVVQLAQLMLRRRRQEG